MSVQALSAAFDMRGIGASEKLVLLALANYANEKMVCWPSQDTLAGDTELSERTVWTALKNLEAKQVIARQPRKRADGTRASDVFTLLFPAHMRAEPVAKSAKPSRNSCDDQSQISQDHPATVATPTTFEPSTNHQKEEPLVIKESATVWMARLEQARDEAGDVLDTTSTGTMHARDLRALCEPASGEPCDWEEVVDAVRLCAARQRQRGKPLRTFAWVKDDAIALRDKRLNANNPGPRETHERSRSDRRQAAFTDRLGDIAAAMDAAFEPEAG